MWPAFVICLLVGVIVGYLYAKVFFKRASPLVEELDKLNDEVSNSQEQVAQLEQQVVDLTYQLGEESKAREYFQKKAEE